MEAGKAKVLKEDSTYELFLSEAEVANRVNVSSPLVSVTMEGTVLPLGVLKKRANSNRSLELIFYFYSRLQDSAAQLSTEAPTFEQILWASNTMSYMELSLFCRDFSIIPTLLSKDELRFIWRVTSPQWSGNLDMRSCRFVDFPDMLVRIAIVAYNKPMMKALLIDQYGHMPAAADLVQALCTYVKLDDMDWVKHRIATVGRETMKSLNFRSVGEVNEHVKEDLRNEIAGRRLAQFMARGLPGHQHHGGGKSPKGKGKGKRRNKIGDPKDISNSGDGDDDDDSEADNDHEAAADRTHQVAKVASRLHMHATGLAGPADVKGSGAVTATPEDKDCWSGAGGSREGIEMNFLDQIFAEARAMDRVTIEGEDHSAKYSGGLGASRWQDASSGAKDGSDRKLTITPDQEQALLRVDHSLRNLLRPYTQIYSSEVLEASTRNKTTSSHCDDPDEDPHFIASGSSYLDLGCIPMSSKVTISLKLTNKGRDDLLFDVVTRELDDQNAVVKTMPAAIAPGLHRIIKVYLEPVPKVTCGGRCVIGYVDVYFKYKRSGGATLGAAAAAALECLSCPVYYKIGHKEEKHINNKDNTGHLIPRCTTKTMARILHKHDVDVCPLYC